ncbi:MAG: ParA family protein [Bacteroidetes bacterium]|nr:ParA family protein [Bacteroidota bacterium]
MEHKKKPLIIAFATQKGGVGKTTFSVLAASYLYYKLGYNVALVDCDYPQYSIEKMRKRDLKQIDIDDDYRMMAYDQFTKLGKKTYPILTSSAENAIQTATDYANASSVTLDIIFIDIPGTVNTDGVLKTLANVDYLFTPIISDRLVLESGLSFAIGINEHIVLNPEYNLKGIYLFWNKVDRRERTNLYEIYEKTIHEFGLSILKTTIPDAKRYRKEIAEEGRPAFRSTVFPIHKKMIKGSNFDELMKEILHIIKL